MKVEIKKRNTDGEESYFASFEYNSELYDTVEKKFTSVIWKKLVSKDFGHEYTYIEGYYEYTQAFGRYGYEGGGIYRKGRLVLSSEDLEDGIEDIEIENNLYFFVK